MPRGRGICFISVLAVAAIATSITIIDIGVAFINTDISSTGIKVNMRLSRAAKDLLIHLETQHARFVEELGTSVVMLDDAIYGYVEAVDLWHANLCAILRGDGFRFNLYNPCMFNKEGPDSAQVKVLVHVGDLFIERKTIGNIARFKKCMRVKYKEVKINNRKVVGYIGMTFDSLLPGQVSITMDNCERSICFRVLGVIVDVDLGCLHPLRYTRRAKGHLQGGDILPHLRFQTAIYCQKGKIQVLSCSGVPLPQGLGLRVRDVDADDMG